MHKTQLFSVSGDWTEIQPGLRVRLRDAPNEEDMIPEYVARAFPTGIIILEVQQADDVQPADS